MKKVETSFLSGLVLGAVSWAIVPLVSDRFEPFDTVTTESVLPGVVKDYQMPAPTIVL